MKFRHIIIVATFIIINILIVASLNFGKKKEKDSAEKAAFVPILSAAIVQNQTEHFSVSGYGTVSSFNAVDLACEIQGKLYKGVHDLKPGIKFRKGDLLFRINDSDVLYTLRARKSGFINILASLLPDLKIDFPTEFDKWNDYVEDIKLNESLPQLPAWKTNKEKIFLSTRNVLTEYFTIKSTEEQLNKYRVYAPFNGVITTVYSSDLAVVNPSTPIIRIVETDNFEIPVSIPASEMAGVKVGTTVAVYSTSGELKGSGSVVRISEVINKNTQSVDVFVRPKSLDDKVFIEGEYVRVEIDKMAEHEGVRLPATAINDNTIYIYSTQDSLLTRREVQISNSNEQGVFIKGLKNNQVVITQEVLNYTDTSKYTVLIQ